jgi:hypothetical protein
MSHYTSDVTLCRVDFFRESGKWYTTEAVSFARVPWAAKHGRPLDAFKLALELHLRLDGRLRLEGMFAVCLDPYHEHSFPLMIRVGDDC